MTSGGNSSTPPPAMRTVARALVLLEHLASARRPLGISELARATGIPKTTVHRLVAVLVAHGMARAGRRGVRGWIRTARIDRREPITLV